MNALRAFVFLGAFLLFAMEPMVGRLLLPSFGGAFHVWTTSLMFFQGALFVGYLYAHLAAGRVGRAHLGLLALPLLWLPPTVALEADAPRGVLGLLTELTVDFGVSFVALATTGVVAQRWLARSSLPGRDAPYVLYAISNAGSLSALLLYALVIEPLVGLSVQRWAWAAGFVAYLVAAALAHRATHRAEDAGPARPEAAPFDVVAPDEERITVAHLMTWGLLAAWPSVFLMAVTNLIALDAGNVPLVWVVPLALYLLSFILAFAEPSRVPDAARRLWPHFAAVGLFFFAGAETGGSWAPVVLQLAVLFAVCLAAHAELHERRPGPRHLTLYYLVLSLGGGLGGAFVALGAPSWFRGLFEYPIGLLGLAATMGILRRRALLGWARGPGRGMAFASLALLAVIGWKLAEGVTAPSTASARTLEVQRSFYGLYYVLERRTPAGAERSLVSGTTRHGRQFMDEARVREPLSYYHRRGPLGAAMAALAERQRPLHVGVVGLGVGAAAAYLGPADTMDFFEIDPLVVTLARRHFRYLSNAASETRVVVGDARLTLAAQASDPQGARYDLLLIDAFAGDAIPTHLVTREAIALYRRLLAPDGVLLFHVSNRYYDLRPALATLAREGFEAPVAAGTHSHPGRDDAEGIDPSAYFLMRFDAPSLGAFESHGFTPITATVPRRVTLWTDDHVNTLAALLAD